MTYPEQLNTSQWKKKRDEILTRDTHACQQCKNAKIVAKAKEGVLEENRFYVKKDNISYVNFVIDPQLTALNNKELIFYGILKNSTCYIIGARSRTSRENEPKAIENELYKKLLESLANNNNMERSLILKEIDYLTRTANSNSVNDFVWVKFIGLHIHHKYYIKGKLAWEYENDALITLCESCHDELHEHQRVPVYNDKMEKVGSYRYCIRCNGKGVFPEYSHVQAGICFRCKGERYEELIK